MQISIHDPLMQIPEKIFAFNFGNFSFELAMSENVVSIKKVDGQNFRKRSRIKGVICSLYPIFQN